MKIPVLILEIVIYGIIGGGLMAIGVFFLCCWINRNTYKDPPNGTVYKNIVGEEEDLTDEHTPLYLDVDKNLKILLLKKKLNKIEKERSINEKEEE